MSPNELIFHPSLGWSLWVSARISCTPSITTSPSFVARARLAWQHILYQQPQLAAMFCFTDKTVTYTPFNALSLEKWLGTTFIAVNDEMQNLYTLPVPLDITILVVNSATRDILLRIPHQYIDGIGIISLLSDLIQLITSPNLLDIAFGDDTKNLAPVFSIAASIPSPLPQDIHLGQSLAAQFLAAPPSIGLPSLTGPPSKKCVSELRLSVDESRAVLEACRIQGWTVTHAVHAALIQATAELDEDADAHSKDYTTLTPYNWRHKLLPEYTRCKAAIYCGTLPTSITKPANKAFSILATELKEIYTSTAYNQSLVRAHDAWCASLLKGMSAMEPAKTCTPNLSSLGMIENVLPSVVNGVDVGGFSLGLDMKVPIAHVFLWSWRGRMSVCAVSDRGIFGEGMVDGLLKLVGQKLAAGLGVVIDEKVGI